MSLFTIILIIFIGLLALLVDILVIPGMVIGTMGGIAIITGIVFAYSDHGLLTGNIVLAGTIVLVILSLILVFRSKTWEKGSLGTTVDGKMNEIDETKLVPGTEGVALGRLAPTGNGKFGEEIVEVRSEQNFIDAGKEIVIVKIEGNKIIVKLKS